MERCSDCWCGGTDNYEFRLQGSSEVMVDAGKPKAWVGVGNVTGSSVWVRGNGRPSFCMKTIQAFGSAARLRVTLSQRGTAVG